MKKQVFIKILLILVFLFATGCYLQSGLKGQIIDITEVPVVEPPSEPKKLTLIVYMAADNDLESAGIANLKQMEHADFDKINVLVLLDRSEDYDRTNGDWTDTRLFEIKHDSSNGNFIISDRLDCPILGLSKNEETELDMANYNVLRNLITFAKTNYEAEKYAVIIWGHGTGWRYLPDGNRAVAIDDTSNTYMTVLNEGNALKGMELSVIGFDSCFSGVIENVYELRDCSSFTVASPDIIPSSGWDYLKLLEDLSHSDFSDYEIARIMSESSPVKTTVFDNSKIADLFNKLEVFSEVLAQTITTNDLRIEALNKLISSKSYSYSQYPCDMFLDVFSITELYTSTDNEILSDKALSLQTALNNSGKTTGSANVLIGIYFAERTSTQTFSAQHPTGYLKAQNNTSQCSFIKDSIWWVPSINKDSDSLMDKLFYKTF